MSGAGPLDRREVLEGHRVPVDPAPLGRRLHHGVLAAHVVGGHRHVDVAGDVGDDVEIGERRLDHDHVGALGHVEGDLGQRLAPVARVLLVAAAVPAIGDGHVDRVAERPVERRRVLGRVGQDGHVGVPGAVERGADGAHLPVHHPARGDHVGPGQRPGRRPRVGRAPAWRRCRRLPSDPSTPQWPWSVYSSRHRSAMSTRVAERPPQLGQRHLDDPVGVPGAASRWRPCVAGHPEEHEPGDPERAPDAWPRPRARTACAGRGRASRRWARARRRPRAHEQGGDQVVDAQRGLGHQPAQGRRAAQAAQAADGEAGAGRVRSAESTTRQPTRRRRRVPTPEPR